MNATDRPYAARLTIDRPETLDRLTTLLRFLWIIPIAVILSLVSGDRTTYVTVTETGERIRQSGVSITFSIGVATALMLLFRQRYPRWWFDFQLALTRFSYRVGAYGLLLRDEYPSTEDEQAVHVEVDYPDAKALSSWLPLVKWLLAIPHYIVLAVLLSWGMRGPAPRIPQESGWPARKCSGDPRADGSFDAVLSRCSSNT